MKSGIVAFLSISPLAQWAIAGPAPAPISAPTLSEWGLLSLALVVAVAAGAAISRRK
jgi:hypothetical protein